MRASHKIVLWTVCLVTYYIASSQIGLYFCKKSPDESITGLVSVLATGIIIAYFAKSGAEKYTNKKFEKEDKTK